MIEFTCGKCNDLHAEQAEKLHKLEEGVRRLLEHAEEQGCLFDSAASEGESKLYYELDASYIEALEKL